MFAQLGVVMVLSRDGHWHKTEFVFAAVLDEQMMAAELWMFHNPACGPQIRLSLVLSRYPLFNLYDLFAVPPSEIGKHRTLLVYCGEEQLRQRTIDQEQEQRSGGLGVVGLRWVYSEPLHFVRLVQDRVLGRCAHATRVLENPLLGDSFRTYRPYWACRYQAHQQNGCPAIPKSARALEYMPVQPSR